MGKTRYGGKVTLRTDGRYMAKVPLDNGTRRSVYGKSEDEVRRKAAKVESDQEKGLPIVSDKRTVAQFLKEWLETKKHTLQPTTYTRYDQLIRLQAIPEIGDVKLSRLTAPQVQKLYTTWRERGLGPTTVKHLHTVLRGAFQQAVKWDYLQRNPSDLVIKPKAATRDMHPLTQEQVGRLLDAAAGDRLEALYVLAVSLGIRQGELLALRWPNIDFVAGTLQVRGTMQPIRGGGLRIAQPKTKSSNRTLHLPKGAVEALKAHRIAQNEERLRLGSWSELDLVFPNLLGQSMGAAVLVKGSFHKLLQRAGLPHMRFHELRHTAATLQLEAGTSLKVVSDMCGHGSIAITADLYAHVTPKMQEGVARVGDLILSQRASGA